MYSGYGKIKMIHRLIFLFMLVGISFFGETEKVRGVIPFFVDNIGKTVYAKEKSDREEKEKTEQWLEQWLSVDEQVDEWKKMQDMVQVHGGDDDFSFEENVRELCQGKMENVGSHLVDAVKKALCQEWEKNRSFFKQCFALTVFVVLLGMVSKMFSYPQVGTFAGYIGFLLLFALLSKTYGELFSLTEKLTEDILTFMGVLLPSFFLMTAAANGQAVASAGYHTTLAVIGIAEILVCKIILPLIELYFYFVMLNQLAEEQLFTKALELLEQLIKWGLKIAFGIVTGMNLVQSLLLPSMQKLRQTTLLKLGQAVPVVGDVASGTAEVLLSVLGLLRNAIGIVGVMGLVLLCMYPLAKLCLYAAIFRLEGAIAQPLGAERWGDCFVGVSKVAGYLAYLEMTILVLFGISILILAMSLGR